MKPKVYLDTCSLQRPLDSKTQLRIVLEAEAVLGVLALAESGEVELVSSQALVFEIRRNPNPVRLEYALEVVSKAKTLVAVNPQVEKRARELERLAIKPLDALHLASAEEAQADYFCTCDDALLKKAKAVSNLAVKVVSPVELAEELEKW